MQLSWCCNFCGDCLQAGGNTSTPSSLSLSPVFLLTGSRGDMTDLSQSPSLPAAPTRTWGMRPSQPEAGTNSLDQSGLGRILRSPVLCLYLAPWRRRGKQIINHENTQIIEVKLVELVCIAELHCILNVIWFRMNLTNTKLDKLES